MSEDQEVFDPSDPDSDAFDEWFDEWDEPSGSTG